MATCNFFHEVPGVFTTSRTSDVLKPNTVLVLLSTLKTFRYFYQHDPLKLQITRKLLKILQTMNMRWFIRGEEQMGQWPDWILQSKKPKMWLEKCKYITFLKSKYIFFSKSLDHNFNICQIMFDRLIFN